MKLWATFEMKPSTCTPRSLWTNRIGKHEVKKVWTADSLKTYLVHRTHRYKFGSLHFDNVPILQYDIRVTLQRGVMAYTVVNWHTSRKSNTCERKSAWGMCGVRSLMVKDANATEDLPFFMSFSFLKIFPVSAMMKESPFSHRLSTETPAIAAPTTVFKASAGQDISAATVWLKCQVSMGR